MLCCCPGNNALYKRLFDLALSLLGLLVFWWLILLSAVIAWIDTGMNGFFIQRRVGRFGKVFNIVKIRTMKPHTSLETCVTTDNDIRITNIGRFFRKTKIDELPQLWNVFIGDMSFVGPRPDVPGYADKLNGEDRLVLSVRPGITGPATLKYRNEEALLAKQLDAENYNREVIFPDKVRINVEYVKNWSFAQDLKYLWMTFTGSDTLSNDENV